jgi:CheY-like chemotaxis protein
MLKTQTYSKQYLPVKLVHTWINDFGSIFCEPPPVERLRDENRKTEERQAQGKTTRDEREVPIIIVCMNDQEAVNMTRNHQALLKELGRIVEVIPQPCGPRKLAKAFTHCLRRAEEVRQGREVGGEHIQVSPTIDRDGEVSQTDPVQQNGKGTDITQQADVKHPKHMDDLRRSVSAAVSYPTPPPFDPETPSLESPSEQRDKELHGPKDEEATPRASVLNDKNPMEPAGRAPHLLLVDDNKINRQLLVMFMKRCNFTYREAENGQEALDVYRDSAERAVAEEPSTSQKDADAKDAEHSAPQIRKDSSSSALTKISSRSRPSPFDFVLMDISMPVMDGMEATRRIREFEKEQGLKKATVIALTGLASEKAREDAETVGIDVFLPKPVKFKELKTLLEMTTRGEVKASVA